jgi:hypothetical protein
MSSVANSYRNAMPIRLRAFGLHLLASACLLSLIVLGLYAGWYYWPGWYLMGAENIVGIMVLVDVGLGPLATLVVASPQKPRRELVRDISLIVLVQLAALGYGAHTLWQGRPLYYVFSLDRAEIVIAADFDEDVIETARKQGAAIIPDWSSRPMWIWAPLPDDAETRGNIIASAITGGHDVTSRPEYFRPLAEGAAAMRERYLPVQSLIGSGGLLAESDYRARLAEIGRAEADLGALPIDGRTRYGTMIFDRASGQPLAFWPVNANIALVKKPSKSK